MSIKGLAMKLPGCSCLGAILSARTYMDSISSFGPLCGDACGEFEVDERILVTINSYVEYRPDPSLLWTLALFCALTVLMYVTYLLAERHQRKHFHTVVADSLWPIKNLAFPVIVVCNKNPLNWSRLPEIKKRYNISKAQEPLLERVLTAYDGVAFGRFDVFNTLHGQPLETLNHLNFTQIVSEMTWRCDELLAECRWQTKARNCCDLFRHRRLPHGICLAFNEVEKRASQEMGRDTGLIVRLQLNSALHAPGNRQPKGFVVRKIGESF